MEELLMKIAHGDEHALDRFMDIWTDRLARYAYCVTGSMELAEEVVSDVFFDLWRSKNKIGQIDNIESWLRVVTLRKAISAIRNTSQRATKVSFDDIEAFAIAHVDAPDHDIMSREQIDCLDQAIDSLPPKCKHVFYLAKIDEVPYKEIAKMLNISIATINYHVSYAMQHLRSVLKNKESVIIFAIFSKILHFFES